MIQAVKELNEHAVSQTNVTLSGQLKGWSHKKKEALIHGDFDLLHELAQSKEMKERRSSHSKSRGTAF